MNAAGQAVAVWIRYGTELTIEAASRTAEGNWSPPKKIGFSGFPGDLGVGIDPNGRAVAVWTRMTDENDYIIEGSSKPPGDSWSPPVALSEAGSNSWDPNVAIDPAGRAIAVWYRYDESGDAVVQAVEKRVGQGWGEPEDLTDGSTNAVYPQVAVNPGRAVVLWEQDQVVEGSVKVGDGAWVDPSTVSGPKSGIPRIAMDPTGNTTAIWVHKSVDGLSAMTAELPVGGSWSEPVTLTERLAGDVAAPKVAVDPRNRAMAVWTAWDGTNRVVEAAPRGLDGSWGRSLVISPPGKWAQDPQVGMDSVGNAASVWRGDVVQAAVHDITDPELNSVSIPAAGRAGQPIAFAASPFDSWSLVDPTTWTFGDDSTAQGSSVTHSYSEAGQFQVAVSATDATGRSTAASRTISITPALATANRVLAVRKGKVDLRLLCSGTAVCRGGAYLNRRTRGRQRRNQSRSIAKFQLTIAGGTERTTTAKLNPRALRLLRASRGHRLRARLVGTAVEPRPVVLKLARPTARRR